MHPRLLPLSSLVVSSSVFLASTAFAQQAPSAPPPPPPAAAPATQPVPYQQTAPIQYTQEPQYTAPLYQQTQPSYVPQSVALSGPRELKDWHDGDPIPPGYHKAERTRTGLIVGGAVTFGVLYLISVLVAAGGSDASGSGSNPVASLYIPVAGPFVQMAHTDSATANVILAIDGIAQAAGAAMLIYGITTPRVVAVRNDLGENKLELSISPIVAKDKSGIGLVGRF